MAYAALVSLAQTIYLVLNHDGYPISVQEKQQIRSIHEHALHFQTFLEDFPDKASSLEGLIRDVAYEAEDTIENLTQVQIRSHRAQLGHHFRELEKVTEKFEEISEQIINNKNSYSIKDEQELCDSPASGACSSRPGSSHRDVMIGFDDDLMAIKALLCGESPQLQVIPIFGMGGIGKSTLARNAYDDPLVLEYFHIRAWVTVSQNYIAQEILSALLVSMKMFDAERPQHVNEEKIYKSLKGRRYLIVMDDMWSTVAWDIVRKIFPDDGNGSRIMLTTRLWDVAAYPDPSSPPYVMRLMDEDQSWNLLRHKVVANQDSPPELENIGKEIAKSCRGLPLAIVVIAGLLSTISKTPASWREIAENVDSVVAAKDGQFEKILSLSYTYMPHHLRPCFLYMAGFPEDYEIRVAELVKLWVAEGFLKRKDGSNSLEEQAEERVEDLVTRSLVFVSKRKSNGKIKSCSIHDLVRDLCIRKAHQERFLLYAEKTVPESIKNHRRLSVVHFSRDCLADHFHDSAIRSVRCFDCRGIAEGSLFSYKLLRVLCAPDTTFETRSFLFSPFSFQVSQLFHLRYLDLHYTNRFTESISNLQNLETLIVRGWKIDRDYPTFMTHLPFGIWRMPKLRHLVSMFFGPLPGLEKETHTLENLQTLSLATNLICTKWTLGKIPNLKKLGIFYYRDYRGIYVEHCLLENLVHLHQLEKLKITMRADFPFPKKHSPAFPTSLKKLTLSGRQLPWKKMTIVGSLPNLEVLKLRDYACKGSTWETNEGEFPELKFLLIDTSDFEHWITESSHFPRLKSLLLHHCSYLTEIPDGIGEIPTLQLIEVDSRNKSLVESAKTIREQQDSLGNDALKVRLVRR